MPPRVDDQGDGFRHLRFGAPSGADRFQEGWNRPEPLAVFGSSYILGRMTVSITWITPFVHAMSVLTTFAPSTFTPLVVSMVTLLP